MEIFSQISSIVKNTWFRRKLDFLEEFLTTNGTYIFSEEYLKANNYHCLLGNHMGLRENRKKQENWCELESDFLY